MLTVLLVFLLDYRRGRNRKREGRRTSAETHRTKKICVRCGFRRRFHTSKE